MLGLRIRIGGVLDEGSGFSPVHNRKGLGIKHKNWKNVYTWMNEWMNEIVYCYNVKLYIIHNIIIIVTPDHDYCQCEGSAYWRFKGVEKKIQKKISKPCK